MNTTMSSPSKDKQGTYFDIQLKVLRIFGVSIEESEGVAYRIYSFITICVWVAYCTLSIYEITHSDLETIADIIIYPTAGILIVFKIIALTWNRKKIQRMAIKLKREPFLPDPTQGGEKEEQLIAECLQVTAVQTYFYWICASFSIALSLAYSLSKKILSSNPQDWKLPYGALSILDTTDSQNYNILWTLEASSIVYMAVLFISADILPASILVHISYHFKILQNRITLVIKTSRDEMIKDNLGDRLTDRNIKIENSSIPYHYLNKNLAKVIDYHLDIIGIAEEMENIFSYVFLSTFLGTLILLCFAVYQSSTVGFSVKLVTFMGEVIAATLQVFLVCFWGDQVAHESERVGAVVFHSDFAGTDLRYQKSLSFIIRRSMNPTKLTAGKFTDVRVTTFAWIARMSYSALMILVREGDPDA